MGHFWNQLREGLLLRGMMRSFVWVARLAGTLALPVGAAQVELRPVADTTIHEVSPAHNMGAHTHVAIGSTAKDTSARGLFRFDVSTVPANATLQSVTLTFTLPALSRPDTAGTRYSAHRVLVPWGEGTKTGNLGAPGTGGEATWNHSALPTAWGAPGGLAGSDYAASASATDVLGPAPGAFTMASTAGLVEDVQAWVTNPGANFGWLLKAEDESMAQTARQFASRETANGVMLRIEYSMEPAGELRIAGIERAGTNVVMRWSGAGTVAVERAGEINGPWQPVGQSAAGVYTNAISGAREFFRLRMD
jgi:hypothetical protein